MRNEKSMHREENSLKGGHTQMDSLLLLDKKKVRAV